MKHTALKIKTAAIAGASANLVEIKNMLDIAADDSKDDAIIRFMIAAAEGFFEQETGRCLIDQTWYAYYPDWPGAEVIPEGRPDYADRIEIPLPPLKSVTAIKYTTSAGVVNTFAASNYVVDIKSEPGGVVPAYTASWPTGSLQVANPIEIEFVCGYGSKYGDVPNDIRMAIAMIVELWFHNRSNPQVVAYAGEPLYIPPVARAVINKYKVFSLR